MISAAELQMLSDLLSLQGFSVLSKQNFRDQSDFYSCVNLQNKSVIIKIVANPQNGDLEFFFSPTFKEEWIPTGILLNYFKKTPVDMKAALANSGPVRSASEVLKIWLDNDLQILNKLDLFFKPEAYSQNMQLLDIDLQTRKSEAERQLKALGK